MWTFVCMLFLFVYVCRVHFYSAQSGCKAGGFWTGEHLRSEIYVGKHHVTEGLAAWRVVQPYGQSIKGHVKIDCVEYYEYYIVW